MSEVILPIAVLVFGLAAIGAGLFVLKHHDKYWMTEAILILSIPLVVTAITFLLTAKIVPENTKELVAILSGVAGFVFGYASNRKPA